MGRKITAAELRHRLHYDSVTGVFTAASGRSVGHEKPRSGYLVIVLSGNSYLAARLAWLYEHGIWPGGVIDHIDHNKLNNAIANLRDVPHASNMQNQIAAHKNNAIGVLGVGPWQGKYRARITVAGRQRYLGSFRTPQEASAAYLAAKRELHSTGAA